MNEVTARILKYYKTLEERHNKEQEPITINNYVFPETHNMQGLREYQGTVFISINILELSIDTS
jgi:hypothetical protein